MSTVVYQSLQSRLETQLMESRSLKLKLSSPKLVFSQSLEMALQSRFIAPVENDTKKLENAISPNLGGWSFLQTLPTTTTTTTSQTPCEKQGPYVHPSVKHSSSWLSEKSLKLCTENLGCETGTDYIENSIFTPSAETKVVRQIVLREKQQQPKYRQTTAPKRPLPPPLTTLRGPESLQVRPHREDGRLILIATKTPAKTSFFQADRSNGRLRLSFIDSANNTSDTNQSQSHQNEDSEHIQIVTNKVITTAPETACSINDEEMMNDGRAGNNTEDDMGDGEEDAGRKQNRMMDHNQQRTASSSSSSSYYIRCNEGHNNTNKIQHNKADSSRMIGAVVTSMVKLEPHLWVSSS